MRKRDESGGHVSSVMDCNCYFNRNKLDIFINQMQTDSVNLNSKPFPQLNKKHLKNIELEEV